MSLILRSYKILFAESLLKVNNILKNEPHRKNKKADKMFNYFSLVLSKWENTELCIQVGAHNWNVQIVC